MIIKNVKVYTEEQKFVPGEIVVLGDRITEVRADGKKRQTAAEALETEPSVNEFSEAEEAEEVVVDGEGATPFRVLLTCISTVAWGQMFAMEHRRR